MRKEDFSTGTTSDPCWFLLDYTFKGGKFREEITMKHLNGSNIDQKCANFLPSLKQ